MKKDFSQPFKKGKSTYFLLLEDARYGDFYAFYKDCGCYDAVNFELKGGEKLAERLVQTLYASGFATVAYRELTHFTETAYSFADETPGELRESFCMHVIVDISRTTPEPDRNTHVLPLRNLIGQLHNSAFASTSTIVGAKALLSERTPWKRRDPHTT